MCVRERERCGVAPFGEVQVLSPLCSAVLPPELLRDECAQEMLLSSLLSSLLISPFHSALFPPRSLTLSLRHAHWLSLPLPPPASSSSSSLLSSSSYIIGYVCVSCCSLVALRAVCSHWKGFPASAHKVEFRIGNTIHRALQAPPPSPHHPSIPPSLYPPSTTCLYPHPFFPPLCVSHGCDSAETFSS